METTENKEWSDLGKPIYPNTEQITRQYIPETNLRERAATLSSKIEHKTVQEFLSDCDKIYQWLVQDEVEKERKAIERGLLAMERYKKIAENE